MGVSEGKEAFFKKFLRAKFLLKLADEGRLGDDLVDELRYLLKYFGDKQFTKEERKTIGSRYNVDITDLQKTVGMLD